MMGAGHNGRSILALMISLLGILGCTSNGDAEGDGEVGAMNSVGEWDALPNAAARESATVAAAAAGSRIVTVLGSGATEVPEIWLWELGGGWSPIESSALAEMSTGVEPLVELDDDGTIYVFGTTRPLCELQPPTISEAFVIEGETSRPLSPAPASLGCITEVVDSGDHLWLDGEAELLRFSKTDETWSSLVWPESVPFFSLDQDDVLDAVGVDPIVTPVLGETDDHGRNRLAVLDLVAQEWLALPPLPSAFGVLDEAESVQFAVANGTFVAWNGEVVASLLDGRWSTSDPSPLPRTAGSGFAALGSQVVVWGGHPQADVLAPPIADGAVYDLATERWSTLAPSPLPPDGLTHVLPLSSTQAWLGAGSPSVGSAGSEHSPWAMLTIP